MLKNTKHTYNPIGILVDVLGWFEESQFFFDIVA